MDHTPAPAEPARSIAQAALPSAAAAARPIALSPAWLVFAALALAIPLAALFFQRALPPRASQLPVIAALPDFALIDQAGRPFARKDLLGRAWVADFIFTRCSDACPRLTAQMKQLQDSLSPEEQKGALRLLSITVDAAHDSPEALRAYAEKAGASPAVWTFLTGDADQLQRAIVDGFKSPFEAPQDAGTGGDFFTVLHGERFILLDPAGAVRGYYDVSEPAELSRLSRDWRALARGAM